MKNYKYSKKNCDTQFAFNEIFEKTNWASNCWKMTREPEEGAESESIYPVYRHTMHGVCWIITWRVCVSCDTTVTWVPVNAVCTHVKEAGSSGCSFVNFFAERER